MSKNSSYRRTQKGGRAGFIGALLLVCLIIYVLCTSISSCSGSTKTSAIDGTKTDMATVATESKDEEEAGDKTTEDKGNKAVNTITEQTASKIPAERVGDFISNFNDVSATPFSQDTTFDPSNGDAPYRPHRYTSPVYKGSSGVHGTCGAFSVTIIGCKNSTEVSATQPDYDYQAVADFARSAVLAMKPDVDQSALDAALDKFVNNDLHTLNFGSVDSDLLESSATGREFFLRVR